MVRINKDPNKRGKYGNAKTGRYKVLNPAKFDGQYAPIYKSDLEHRMMIYLDKNPNIIKWSYEKFAITYLDMSTVPPKKRRYYIDFIAYAKKANGIQKLWIEVKDSRDTKKPDPSKVLEYRNYIRNISKWKQARITAQQNNAEFHIITEEQLKS